jgi:hypothetical protein
VYGYCAGKFAAAANVRLVAEDEIESAKVVLAAVEL